jgi:hypothetical protein
MVIVIEANNKAGPVWLLQDFKPERDGNAGPYTIDVAKNKKWGLFHGIGTRAPGRCRWLV